MRYDKAEILHQLAAEYAIGTLRGGARRRFQRLLQEDPDARAQVAFWDQRLAEFGQILQPVTPPPQARQAVLHRATPLRAPNTVPRRRARWRRLFGRLALYGAGFATAAGLLLALLVVRGPSPRPASTATLPPAAVAVAPAEHPFAPAALPIYTAQMRMPGSRMGWLLSMSPDRRQLIVVAAEDFLQIGRHRLQLWCQPPHGDPIPLGVLPNERDATTVFEIPERVRGLERVRFSVSLEPERGPSGGRRSSMVLDEAAALDAI